MKDDLTMPQSIYLNNHMFTNWTSDIEYEYISQTGSTDYGDLDILNPES